VKLSKLFVILPQGNPMIVDEYSYTKPENKDRAIETATKICQKIDALNLRLTKLFPLNFQVSEQTCHIHYVSNDLLEKPEHQVEYEALRKLIDFINSWI
jgi:hypothetical protein